MLDALNALFLAANIIAQPIYTRNSVEITMPQLGQVAYGQTYKATLFGEPDCHYSGLVIPYERDWEEVYNEGTLQETRVAPEPGKFAGYVYILNKAQCKGKPDQLIRHVYDCNSSRCNTVVKKDYVVKVLPLTQDDVSFYKWLPQVMKRIEDASATNTAAKAFMDFNAQANAPKTAEAMPEQAERVR
ncbi:MAG: hypothetical protein ACK4FE_02635 [Azonexus sp.]